MKKEKYREYNGLFGDAIDYKVYHMTIKEIVLGAMAGAGIGAVVIMIFFNLFILTLLAIPFCGAAGILILKNMLLENRKKKLLFQFRDMLESISASFGSGQNVSNAFQSALKDMQTQYGDSAYIVEELKIINHGILSNIRIEELLLDFAKRSHNENIQSFADVFTVANKRGGDIRQVIFETKNVINEKIMVEQDIQTLISGKKNELNIMMLLPLIVVNQTKAMQGNAAEDVALNFIIKLAAFGMFAIAYVIGQKMMKIEV